MPTSNISPGFLMESNAMYRMQDPTCLNIGDPHCRGGNKRPGFYSGNYGTYSILKHGVSRWLFV